MEELVPELVRMLSMESVLMLEQIQVLTLMLEVVVVVVVGLVSIGFEFDNQKYSSTCLLATYSLKKTRIWMNLIPDHNLPLDYHRP